MATARLPQGGRAFVVSTTVESGATGDVEPRRTRLPQGGRAFVVSTTVELGATGDVEPRRTRLPQGGRAFVVSTTVESGATGDVEPRRTSERAARRNAPDDPPPLSPFAVVLLVLLVFPSSACRTSNRAARRNAPDDPPHFPPHPPFPAAPCGDSLFREMQTMQAYCKHIALACAVNAAFACMQRDAMHA